jgi:hypothetical protein
VLRIFTIGRVVERAIRPSSAEIELTLRRSTDKNHFEKFRWQSLERINVVDEFVRLTDAVTISMNGATSLNCGPVQPSVTDDIAERRDELSVLITRGGRPLETGFDQLVVLGRRSPALRAAISDRSAKPANWGRKATARSGTRTAGNG